MTDELPEAMEGEFDRLAGWMAEVLDDLGLDEAIAAACRGSGNPAALAWLAEELSIGPTTRFLDAGGGLGGPAAWLRRRWALPLVLAEPMPGAARGARARWGFPTVVAWAERLPLRSASFDAAWALGVLDTTGAKADLLRELHRVVVDGGRLGLIAYERADHVEPEAGPDGNEFPTLAETAELLATCGWAVVQRIDAADVAGAPAWWDHAADAAEDRVLAEHRDDPVVDRVEEQQEQMGALLRRGDVVSRLYHLRRLAVPR